MRARPNLLILMADQLSAGVLPAYGGVRIGMGVEAGFVIVLLAVILDRIMRIKRT